MNKNNTSPQSLLDSRRRSIAQSIYDHYPFKVEMIARGDWHYGYATSNTLSLAIAPCQFPNAPWTMKIRFEEKGCRPVYLMILQEGSFKSIYPDLLEDSPIFHNAIAACTANGSHTASSPSPPTLSPGETVSWWHGDNLRVVEILKVEGPRVLVSGMHSDYWMVTSTLLKKLADNQKGASRAPF